MSGKGGKRDPKKEKGEDKELTTFKPAHIKRCVKKLTKMRVSKDTLKATSSAITYIILEILDGAKSMSKNEGKKKTSPRHINSAITSDDELSILLKNYVSQSGGIRQKPSGESASKK